MKTIMKYLLCLMPFAAPAQQGSQSASQELATLYVSKSTGEFSTFTGSFSKTTDNYETGNFYLNTDGPIFVTVSPDLAISTNETKTWTGTVTPDVGNAPPEGQTAEAHIYYNGTITYSRPATGYTDQYQTIDNTYVCPKCPTHESGGMHELVTETNQGMFVVMVHTVDVKIKGPDCAYKGSELELEAEGSDLNNGTYEWKSNTPNILEVTGNGAKATVTCKGTGGLGKGDIEVTYDVNGVTKKQTKTITFFKLVPKLSKTSICDGTGVSVTLTPMPDIKPVAKVKECLDNLAIKYKPVLAKNDKNADIPADNIVKHTNINFSAVTDQLTAKADTIYWFISHKNMDACAYVCNYEIWAEADNKFGKDKVTTDTKSLGVSVAFSNCVNGTSHLMIDVPNINGLLYKLVSKDFPAGGLVFETPEGPFPDLVINFVRDGQINFGGNIIPQYRMKGQFTKGSLSLSRSVETNITSPASQFYELVEFEESFHTDQFRGINTAIPELQNLLSADDVVARANKLISTSRARYGSMPNDQAILEHVVYCKQMLQKSIAIEVGEYNTTGMYNGKNLRCLLENEAKVALAAKFGNLFTVGMPCAYGWCFKKGYLPKP